MECTIVVGSIGLIASLFISPSQIYKTLKTKSVDGISLTTYYLLLFVCITYLIRAISIKEYIFILSNLFGVLATIIMIVLIHRYKK